MAFEIAAGVPCQVRGKSDWAWRGHTTTRHLIFFRYERREADSMVFREGDWELRVHQAYVNDGEHRGYRPASRGKGASRRSAQRSVKGWKNRR